MARLFQHPVSRSTFLRIERQRVSQEKESFTSSREERGQFPRGRRGFQGERCRGSLAELRNSRDVMTSV